jgi:hypothetical protein
LTVEHAESFLESVRADRVLKRSKHIGKWTEVSRTQWRIYVLDRRLGLRGKGLAVHIRVEVLGAGVYEREGRLGRRQVILGCMPLSRCSGRGSGQVWVVGSPP